MRFVVLMRTKSPPLNLAWVDFDFLQFDFLFTNKISENLASFWPVTEIGARLMLL